jgi:hypothetical protein
MLILVAAITFVDIAVESHDERGVLFLGLGIAVVIVALTAFLRFGRRTDADPRLSRRSGTDIGPDTDTRGPSAAPRDLALVATT